MITNKLLTNTDRERLVTPDSVLAEGGAGTKQGELTSEKLKVSSTSKIILTEFIIHPKGNLQKPIVSSQYVTKVKTKTTNY